MSQIVICDNFQNLHLFLSPPPWTSMPTPIMLSVTSCSTVHTALHDVHMMHIVSYGTVAYCTAWCHTWYSTYSIQCDMIHYCTVWVLYCTQKHICMYSLLCMLYVCSDDYFRMKLQWKSIDADQELRFSDLRDRRSLIGMFAFVSVCLYVYVCMNVCLSLS